MAQIVRRGAVCWGNVCQLMVAHRDKYVASVQHLVVLEVVQQGAGHRARLRRQKDRCACHARDAVTAQHLQKLGQ